MAAARSGSGSGASGAVLGAGMFMGGIGRAQADYAQADAERENAQYYREQADFAAQAGRRQRDIFERDSKILVGDQLSAFAKAGIDTQASSFFIANTTLQRSRESGAIKAEADMNVRLASLRANQASQTAWDLDRAGDTETFMAFTSFGMSLV